MILLTYKSKLRYNPAYTTKEMFNERLKCETYRLITIIHDGLGVKAVMCRMSDEMPLLHSSDHNEMTKFKGDIFTEKIENLRVIHASTSDEDEVERYKYLNELKELVTQK